MKYVIIAAMLTVCAGQRMFAQIGSRLKTQGIAGIWENNEFGFTMTLMLMDNGTGEFDGEAISYSASDNDLTIKSPSGSNTYRYVLSAGNLTLSGGDLDGPVSFKRRGDGAQSVSAAVETGDTDVIGRWEFQGQVLDFRADGQVLIDGNVFQYRIQKPQLVLVTQQGSVQFQYQVLGDKLTLTGPGGSVTYQKITGEGASVSTQVAGIGQGVVPQELAGKWCYVNVASTNSGSWSTDECITLHENGTYEYYSESSGSATVTNQYGGQVASGGTASQNSDAGTWSLQGNMIVAQSRSGASQSFTLEKRNHPKNGDPMIVLNGRTYVTFYNKTPWR